MLFLTKSTVFIILPWYHFSSQKPSDHSWHFFSVQLPTSYLSPSHVNSTLKYKYHIISVLDLFAFSFILHLLSSLSYDIGNLALKSVFPGSYTRWFPAVFHKWRAMIEQQRIGWNERKGYFFLHDILSKRLCDGSKFHWVTLAQKLSWCHLPSSLSSRVGRKCLLKVKFASSSLTSLALPSPD